MEQSTTIIQGGMTIKVAQDNMVYVSVSPSNTLWTGSIGQLEAIFESHQLLKDACNQFLNAMKDDDEGEIQNAIYSANQALSRAD